MLTTTSTLKPMPRTCEVGASSAVPPFSRRDRSWGDEAGGESAGFSWRGSGDSVGMQTSCAAMLPDSPRHVTADAENRRLADGANARNLPAMALASRRSAVRRGRTSGEVPLLPPALARVVVVEPAG